MRASTPLKTIFLLFATSTTAHPQSFSLAIGFGSDDSPLTFFPDLATPAPAPSRSAPAPPQQAHIAQPLPATQPSVPRSPPRRPPQSASQKTQQRQPQSAFQSIPRSLPSQQQVSLPRNPPVFDTIGSSQREGAERQESRLSHSEALARNAAARQQLEEVIAQHNQRSGFEQQAPGRQPNHFEQTPPKQRQQFLQPEAVPSAPRRPQQQNLSPRKVPKQIESSEASVRKLSHDEALQRNALHRQQLAEVVAKHADKVDEVTKTLKIPEDDSREESRRPPVTSQEVPRGEIVDRFLAKKTSPNKSQPTKESKTSEVSSQDRLVDEEYPDQLLNHLELLSELDKQVEDLFSQALDIFSEEIPERAAERKGGKRKDGRRNQGKRKGSGRRTKQKDPRKLAE